MTLNSEIIKRLKKVQALSEKGVEGEAENAARMLAKLLAKHRLSMKDLDIPQDEEDFVRKDRLTSFVGNATWERQLAFAVARYFDCKFAYIAASKSDTIVGHGEDIECFTFLFTVARRQIISTVETAKKSGEIKGRTQINGYKVSMVMGFDSKLNQVKDEISHENVGYAIVLADRSAMVRDFVEKNCRFYSNRPTSYQYNSSGYDKGTKIRMDKGIRGGMSKRLN